MPLGLLQRMVTATYDCVTQRGLANYKLLPELISAAKTGDTDLPRVQYQASSSRAWPVGTPLNLPTVQTLARFQADVSLAFTELGALYGVAYPAF